MRGVQVTRKKRIASLIAALIIAMMSTMVFISANAASDTYVPRLTAPSSDNEYYFSSKNIFYSSGYGMPNCTAYAYGRAYEILGSKPSLPCYDARRWYELTTGYEKGQEPRVGAIACWWSESSGHVAVVEKIEDGVVTFSNSSWSGTMFYLTTGKADGSDNFGGNSSWKFQGFIYLLDDDGSSEGSSGGATDSGNNETPVNPIGVIGENQLMRVNIKVNSLAVRSNPSTDASAIGYISTGSEGKDYFVSELCTDTKYCWGKINYGGREGWIALSTWATNEGCYTYGDVDMDGSLTILDSTKMQRSIARLDKGETTDLYDCDKDGDFDIADCVALQKILAVS